MPFLLISLAGAAFLLWKAFSPAKDTKADKAESVTGLQKIVGGVAGVVATAGAAVKVGTEAAALLGIGKAAATGTATAGSVTASGVGTASTGLSVPASGSASGLGAGGSALSTTAATIGLLAAPFILGPMVAKLLGGKTLQEWEAELAKKSLEERLLQAAIMKKAIADDAAARARAERDIIHGLGSVYSGNTEGTQI